MKGTSLMGNSMATEDCIDGLMALSTKDRGKEGLSMALAFIAPQMPVLITPCTKMAMPQEWGYFGTPVPQKHITPLMG